jgi:hypothetical protein
VFEQVHVAQPRLALFSARVMTPIQQRVALFEFSVVNLWPETRVARAPSVLGCCGTATRNG